MSGLANLFFDVHVDGRLVVPIKVVSLLAYVEPGKVTSWTMIIRQASATRPVLSQDKWHGKRWSFAIAIVCSRKEQQDIM